MKHLYLLRGCPGSGKSTWIKENKLEKYTISSDKLRLLFPCSIDENGQERISQLYDTKVWNLLYDLMEERMKIGQPIIIDATHYRGSFIKSYKPYCEKYGYEIVIIDFPIDINEAKIRNKQRPGIAYVPEHVIDKMAETLKVNEKEMKSKYKFLSKNLAVSEILQENDDNKPKQLTVDIFKDICNQIKIYSQKEDKSKVIQLICEYFPEYKVMINFNQDNKYHNMTLDNHSWEVCKNIPQTFDGILFFGALFHDIGKPYVAKKGADGYTHFYDHARIGALLFSDKMYNRLINAGVDKKEASFINYLIKHHDDEISDNFIQRSKEDGLTDYEIHSLLVLQYADAKAHVKGEKIQQRIDKCIETIKNIIKED